MVRKASGHASATYGESAGATPNAPRLMAIVSCVAAIGALVYGLQEPRPMPGGEPEITPSTASVIDVAATPLSSAASENVLAASPLPSVEPSPASPNPSIGIVAGHWGSDTGAVCPDGLKEVDVNLDIGRRVVQVLHSLGYQADLMQEFDPRLDGYWAYALVSIHSDSCEHFPNAVPPASGFKVARVEDSMVPAEEDRLVVCLSQSYAARTGMFFHSNSVTHDMTRYHTFYEIDGRTPAAIIEAGFMKEDRYLLTQRADLVAQGIADGIVCFLESGGAP